MCDSPEEGAPAVSAGGGFGDLVLDDRGMIVLSTTVPPSGWPRHVPPRDTDLDHGAPASGDGVRSPGADPRCGGAVVGGVSAVVAWRHRSRAASLAEEAKAKLAEADAIKNDFVTMVSHEFRTPLASITGFAQLLAGWRDLPDTEVDEFLGLISIESVKLGNLVEDVLVIPRLEAGRLKLDQRVFDLSAVVHEVSALVLPTAGDKEVSISIPGGITAWGDQRRMEQVIRNLLENAKRYGGDQVLVEGFTLGRPLRGGGLRQRTRCPLRRRRRDLRALRAGLERRRSPVAGHRPGPADRPSPCPCHGWRRLVREALPHRQPVLRVHHPDPGERPARRRGTGAAGGGDELTVERSTSERPYVRANARGRHRRAESATHSVLSC
jgi:hypothetical protein